MNTTSDVILFLESALKNLGSPKIEEIKAISVVWYDRPIGDPDYTKPFANVLISFREAPKKRLGIF